MKVLNMLTSEDIKRIKAQTDMSLLIEHYKKEIWKWKQKESQWISDKNLLEGSKKTIDEIATKLVELSKENVNLKKRAQEAEGENTIIKGIGNTSPEMRALQTRVKELDNSLSIALEINDKFQRENEELKKELSREKEDRQYDSLVHAKELKKALQR
tara:strand:- start:60 stop:530 length:471 start_codon:yes stop_codon:yes gene_type:complete